MRRAFPALWTALSLCVACGSSDPATDVADDVADTTTDAGDHAPTDAGDDTRADPGPDATPLPPMTVVSYNAGLAAGYVDYAPQRLPLLGPAIAALDADLVCLQEVWTDDDAAAIVAAAPAFPHAYREATEDEAGSGGPACTAEEIGPLQTCAVANCAGEPPENLATCVLGKCGTEFDAIGADCQTCLVSQIGQPLEAMVATCTAGAGGTYAYEGRNGVLILSKHPLGTKEFLRMDSYLNVRVVLHAVVRHPQWGDLDVFCTHLTADLSDVAYGGAAGSWGAEQAAQIDAMLAWIDQKKVAPQVVLAGDMNSGPANDAAGIAAEHPENYAKFAAGGYSDPYVLAEGDTCSWCADNPLVGGGSSRIIDHVLLAGYLDVNASARRVLDAPVELGTQPPVTSRLSDHYGVAVTFNAPVP